MRRAPLPLTPPPHPAPRKAGGKQGFAILISITLLAFLVLLLLSLALLTRVGTQISANGLQDAVARQNALVGLKDALGQLEKYAGPDQRTTAPAEFGDFSAGANGGVAVTPFTAANTTGVVTPGSGTRWWTGVWGNSSAPGAIFSQTPVPKLLAWLVSGNEGVAAPTVTPYGQVTAAPAMTFTPSATVAGINTASYGSTLTISSQPAVLLVGGNSASSSSQLANYYDNYVAAPLVNLSTSAQMLPGFTGAAGKLTGRMAWVVLDEGVKAKVNVRDPYDGSNTLAGTGAANIDARVRVQAAQRTGIELVTGFGDASGTNTIAYPNNTANATLNSEIDRVMALEEVRYLDANATSNPTAQVIRQNFNTLTPYSFGVLADQQFGGLRKDLTALLEDTARFNATLAGKNILPDSGETARNLPLPSLGDTALGSVTPDPRNVSPKNFGPQWDLIKSFYGIGSTLTTSSASQITARTGSATVMPITPVFVQSRQYFKVSVNPGNDHFLINTFLYTVVGNPYTSTLSVPNGVSFFYVCPSWGYNIGGANPWVVTGLPSGGYGTGRGTGGGYPILNEYYWNGSSAYQAPPYSQGASLNGFLALQRQPLLDTDSANPSAIGAVTFKTPPFTIPPGQLASFIIASGQSNSSTNPQFVCNMMNATNSGTQILTNCLTYDTNVVIPSGSVNVNVTDWSAGAIYMCDPATATNTSPGKVYQAMMGNDLPGSTNGSFGATANTTGVSTTFTGFMYILSLPGVTHSAHGGPSASSQGVVVQSGQDHRVFADYNLVANYHCVPWTSSPWGGYDFVPPYDDFFLTDFAGDFASNAVPPYWGDSYQNGPSLDTVMFDLPRRNSPNEEPVLSLGFLQFANLAADDAYPFAGNQPGYAVGNSWFNVFESRLATVQSRPAYYFAADGTDAGPVNCYDISYLLNCALWDHYYFSSIPQAATPLTINPVNPRLVYAAGVTPSTLQLGLGVTGASGTDSTGLALPKEQAPSRYLMINGAFNVNSTSIDAWKAVLASLRKRSATMNDAAGATTLSTSFARSLYQTTTYSQADTGTATNSYSGFRKLSDAQIASLSTCIVQEVRLRGPFTGMADFINRSGITGVSSTSLSSTQANTVQVSGALQTAIDRAGLNTTNLQTPIAGADVATSVANNNNTICMADQMPQVVSPATALSTPGACATLNRATGIPGWLTQADLLQALGPALAARSDTFVIRAYGEALDPINTGTTVVPANILSRAWCEAVVQRFPDYVDPSNAAAVDPSGATGTGTTITAANQKFGRKFRIVSFRWLTPNDI